jgi:hypothetical protein
MASSQSKTGSPLQSTRQMLDELDSLMERMLALPVGDVEDLPPLPRDVPALSSLAARLTDLPSAESLPSEDEETPAPTKSSRRMESPVRMERTPKLVDAPEAPSRLHDSDDLAGPHFDAERDLEETFADEEKSLESADDSPPPVDDRPVFAPVPAEPLVDLPRTEATAAPASSFHLSRVPLLPLLAINLTFEAGSYLLGPIGSLLRGQRGRGFLGFVGLLCLGLAGAWIVFDQISGR